MSTGTRNDDPFAPFATKMREAGLPEVAIRNFERAYAELGSGSDGSIPDSEIEPLDDVPEARGLTGTTEAGNAALAKTVVIKLNGGLGTSMGMTRAKSLLEIRGKSTFLDVIARQMQSLRKRTGQHVPLILMNSFRTQADSLARLAPYGDLSAGLSPDFLQHKVPRILADGLGPASWPAEPEHEWCPPGHGDLYPALVTSGLLEALLERGFEKAFVSNADNLGAVLDPAILGWFVTSGAPFAMEVKRRTEADRKGGHLARGKGGGLLLREVAQCPDADRPSFEDIERWRFFNTNNLWLDLRALHAALERHQQVLPLPLIRNEKPIDPADADSPRVLQLETAMGSAISVFDGALAIRVEGDRFAPVKTTGDLLVVRSDAYVVDEAERVVPAPGLEAGRIVVDLDPAHFKRVDDMERHFQAGPPSLRGCRRLRVRGDVHFGADVVVEGDVSVEAPAGERLDVADGSRLRG